MVVETPETGTALLITLGTDTEFWYIDITVQCAIGDHVTGSKVLGP